MRKSIVKKGKVKNTFICLCMLFKEFHVRFGTESNRLYNLLRLGGYYHRIELFLLVCR